MQHELRLLQQIIKVFHLDMSLHFLNLPTGPKKLVIDFGLNADKRYRPNLNVQTQTGFGNLKVVVNTFLFLDRLTF